MNHRIGSCVAAVLLAAWLAAAATAAATAAGAAIERAEYEVKAGDAHALVALRLDIKVPKEALFAPADWARVPLLSSAIHLRSAEVEGGRGYVAREEERYVAHLRAGRDYNVRLSFALDVRREGAESSLALPVLPAGAVRVQIAYGKPGDVLTAKPDCPIERPAPGESPFQAVLYPSASGDLVLSWLPEALAREQPPVFEIASSIVTADALPAGARQLHHLDVKVRRGLLDGIAFALPEGASILSLSARRQGPRGPRRNILADWRVVGGRVEAEFSEPVADTCRVAAMVERLPEEGDVFVVEPLAVEGQASHSGDVPVLVSQGFASHTLGMDGMASEAAAPAAAPGEAATLWRFARSPASLRLRVARRSPRIAAEIASHVRLHAEVVELEARIACTVEHAPVDRLRFALDEGLVPLALAGDEVAQWAFEEGEGGAGVLAVSLKRPLLGRSTLTLRAVQDLREINGILIPRVRSLDAERETGAVGVSAGDDVALVPRTARRLVQVDLDRLPEWLQAVARLGYLYEEAGGLLAVDAHPVRPFVRATAQVLARVEEDAVGEEYTFEVEAERRPVFALRFALPEGLAPLGFLGDGVADWGFSEAHRTLSVELESGLLGRSRFHLVCERRRQGGEGILPLGGVTLKDADAFSGKMGVGVYANLRLRTTALENCVSADPRGLPPLARPGGDQTLGFQWTGAPWGVECRAERVFPRIEARTREALLFRVGSLEARSDIALRVENARIEKLTLQLPQGAFRVQVDGEGVLSAEQSGDECVVRFFEPVRGDVRLRASCLLLPDAAGRVSWGGFGLPEAHRVSGVAAVYKDDDRLEVLVESAEGAEQAAAAPDPEMGGRPSIGAFAHQSAQRRLVFALKDHALAEGVRLHAETAEVETVVQRQGQVIHYMALRVRNQGEPFLRLRLPEGGVLWGTYIEGRPVRPGQSDGEIVVPLQNAPRHEAFEAAVIWSESSGRGRGGGLGLAPGLGMSSPRLVGVPTQAVSWRLHLPSDYEVVRAGGNMELLAHRPWHERGLPGAVVSAALQLWQRMAGALTIALTIMAIGAAVYTFYWMARGIAWLLAAARGKEPRTAGSVVVSAFIALGILVILAGLFLPALSTARESARRASCSSNLSQIGRAVRAYSERHQGRVPPSLDALFPEFLDQERAFISPASGERYLYFGPIDPRTARPGTPIASAVPLEGGQNVLYHDGHVRFETRNVGDILDEHGMAQAAELARRRGMEVARALELADKPTAEIGLRRVARPDAPQWVLSQEAPEAALEDVMEERPADAERVAADARRQRRADTYTEAMQMGRALQNVGRFDEARQQFEQAQRIQPGAREPQESLDRLGALAKEIPPQRAPAEQAARELHSRVSAPPPRLTHPLGMLPDVIADLQRRLGEDWDEDIALDATERAVLRLVSTGEAADIGGVRAEARRGTLTLEAPAEDARTVLGAADSLRVRLMALRGELLAVESRREAERAARLERARALRDAAERMSGDSGGTMAGSRAAGALPLELRFPAVGTVPYPFRMEFAGDSVAKIEVRCVRRGAAMVLQGTLALGVLAGVAGLAWRRPQAAAAAAAVLALVLLFLLKTGGEAPKEYLAVALAGLVLAAPVVIVRFVQRVKA